MDGVKTEQNIVVLQREKKALVKVSETRTCGSRTAAAASTGVAWRHRHTFSSSMRTAMGYSSSLELGASAMACRVCRMAGSRNRQDGFGTKWSSGRR